MFFLEQTKLYLIGLSESEDTVINSAVYKLRFPDKFAAFGVEASTGLSSCASSESVPLTMTVAGVLLLRSSVETYTKLSSVSALECITLSLTGMPVFLEDLLLHGEEIFGGSSSAAPSQTRFLLLSNVPFLKTSVFFCLKILLSHF